MDASDASRGSRTATDENEKSRQGQGPSSHRTRYGRCKWFNVAKGWGFIVPHDGGPEVFVHQSVIQMKGFRLLNEQEEVEFECKLTERGLEATRVSGLHGVDCQGNTMVPIPRGRTKRTHRRMRCYNCGEYTDHIAANCELEPQPKRCHICKQDDHLFADCPMRIVNLKPRLRLKGQRTDSC